MNFKDTVGAGYLFILVALVLTFITVMCVIFLVKSYRAGLKLGIDKKVLKKTIISSATFTLLPSISILLGVIALSGALGRPFSWLRLSVIGALQYELNVADMAAESLGLEGLNELSMPSEFTTIAFVMTLGILGGVFCCIFFLKKYMSKLNKKTKKEISEEKVDEVEVKKRPGFGAYATTAMFVGLCAAYIGSYVGQAIPREGSTVMPLIVAIVAAVFMSVFEFLIQKKNMKSLENFSLAASMLLAMAAAVIIEMYI